MCCSLTGGRRSISRRYLVLPSHFHHEPIAGEWRLLILVLRVGTSVRSLPCQVEDYVYDLLPDNAGTGMYALPMPRTLQNTLEHVACDS